MKSQHSFVAILALAVVFAALAASGCRRHQEVDPDEAYRFLSWKVNDVLDELDANDKQRTELNAVKDQLFDVGIALRDEGKALRALLVLEWAKQSPDQKRMHDEVDLWFDEARKAAHTAVDASLSVHFTLNAEQRAKLLEKAAKAP